MIDAFAPEDPPGPPVSPRAPEPVVPCPLRSTATSPPPAGHGGFRPLQCGRDGNGYSFDGPQLEISGGDRGRGETLDDGIGRERGGSADMEELAGGVVWEAGLREDCPLEEARTAAVHSCTCEAGGTHLQDGVGPGMKLLSSYTITDVKGMLPFPDDTDFLRWGRSSPFAKLPLPDDQVVGCRPPTGWGCRSILPRVLYSSLGEGNACRGTSTDWDTWEGSGGRARFSLSWTCLQYHGFCVLELHTGVGLL